MKREFDPITGFPLWFPERLRFKRYISSSDFPRPEKGHCRYCGEPVEKGRKVCCDACASVVSIYLGFGIDYEIEKRDKCICAACGIDTGEVRMLMRLISAKTPHGVYWYSKEFKAQWGPWGIDYSRRLYEIDHIIPVCEGGGCCDLRNLRTLCLKCHKEETKAMHGRRKRTSKRNLSLDFPGQTW